MIPGGLGQIGVGRIIGQHGLRVGAHEVTFDIEGELYIPALGREVAVTGEAVGVVQVRNPTFSIILSHPDVVRDGEPYSLYATVTNTSNQPVNFFQLALRGGGIQGAHLATGAQALHSVDLLGPRQSETFEFEMVADTTGQVAGTVFLADAGINGSFVLETGVGDTGIPLSPDTLVLPQIASELPPDLLFAENRPNQNPSLVRVCPKSPQQQPHRTQIRPSPATHLDIDV